MKRDYEIARTKYQSVVSRKVEAEIAQELEAKSAKSLFNVISPAGRACRPGPAGPLRRPAHRRSWSPWPLGVLTGVVLEMRDDSLRDGHELRERLTAAGARGGPEHAREDGEAGVDAHHCGARTESPRPTTLN